MRFGFGVLGVPSRVPPEGLHTGLAGVTVGTPGV